MSNVQTMKITRQHVSADGTDWGIQTDDLDAGSPMGVLLRSTRTVTLTDDNGSTQTYTRLPDGGSR